MAIRAIETRYKGYRFRSRKEARFAVALDSLGHKWEYEKEGFKFDNGICYLPDFFLPELNNGIWIEIKGNKPTIEEVEKAIHLCTSTKQDVYIEWSNFDIESAANCFGCYYDSDGVFHTGKCLVWFILTPYYNGLADVLEAWEAARAARFDGKRRGLPWLDIGDVTDGELPY